jgi:hypothetical protein
MNIPVEYVSSTMSLPQPLLMLPVKAKKIWISSHRSARIGEQIILMSAELLEAHEDSGTGIYPGPNTDVRKIFYSK